MSIEPSEAGSAVQVFRGEAHYRLNVPLGVSLLDVLAAEGINPDYACKRGDCGQCAATLIQGEVHALSPAFPYRRGKDVLLCNSAACADVSLRLPWYPEAAHLRTLRSPCRIDALRKDNDVAQMVLRVPPSLRFDYLPGQFIKLTLPGGVTRSYSLARAPTSDRRLHVHVRRVHGGAFSEYLFERAVVGDLLQLEGPCGHFFLRQGRAVANSIFLATGTGIAPIFAMLEGMSAEQRKDCGRIHIYWGNRQVADAYLHHELGALSARVDASCEILTSRTSNGDAKARYVQHAMARDFQRLDDAQVYACGNPAMIEDAARIAAERGLKDDRFICDPFTAS